MDTLQSSHTCSFFSNEDVRAIEDAVRAAIKVVLKVFCTINNNKVQGYHKKMAAKDKENEVLRIRMERAERELITLRRFRRSVEQCGANVTMDSNGDGSFGHDSGLSSEDNGKQRLCVSPEVDDEHKDVLSQCMWKTEFVRSYEGMDSGVHAQDREATECGVEGFTESDLNPQEPSERAVSPVLLQDQPTGQPETGRKLSASPVTPLEVKEEPLDLDTVYIKWEVSEESIGREGGCPMSKCVLGKECEVYPRPSPFIPLSQHRAVGTQNSIFWPSEQSEERLNNSASYLQKRLSNRERQQRYRDRIRADPERQRVFRERDRSRYQKRRKLICDLPEHTQKLKREAWREAARRHRARKKIFTQTLACTSAQSTGTIGHCTVESTGKLEEWH
ncbi:uncharacterized protein LOC118785181 [Megalops cyprinoides]|uniref:uncharacterized protein LOC118785181 n=1 Tax=Megalops cyprinoides TaxID=118141 RepID=UPI001864AC1E|nr:uncharacterized protein LOC118785181 [Megalops cyprinoides]